MQHLSLLSNSSLSPRAGWFGLLVGAAFLLGPDDCQAGELHRSVRLGDLEIVEGELPNRFPTTGFLGSRGEREALLAPRVVLDAPGAGDRALILAPEGPQRFDGNLLECRLVARVSRPGAFGGRLFLPLPDLSGMTPIRFRMPPGEDSEEARSDFRTAELQHVERLLRANAPGSAWFRFRADQLRRLRKSAQEPGDPGGESWSDPSDPSARAAQSIRFVPTEESEMQRTLAMFSGARAISENLRLDRMLAVAEAGQATVDVDGLEGISVPAYDWTARVAGIEVTPEPLATRIPSDQHAVFFASFAALLQTIDELDRSGTPLRSLFEEQATDSFTRARYERQLCLELNQLTRQLGPLLIDSVALTGSDPYLRTGSDVALMFRAGKPEALLALIGAAQQAARARNPLIEQISGAFGSLRYVGVRSPDRSICSLVARRDEVVLVTNSTVQIEALAAVLDGRREALSDLDEYRFFRHRYPVGADGESALLILTDATIRRWCGPRWRIGASRRIRAAAAMAHRRAQEIERLADRSGGSLPAPEFAGLYGNLEFQTPIAELDLARVTRQEAAAYDRFRRNYQRRWRQFFDPIALRLSINPQGGFASDLTVLPLVAQSDFREYLAISQGAEIGARTGDLHPEALFHFTQAVNIDSAPLREIGEFFKGMLIGFELHPLSWMDGSFSVYVDDDPLWEQLAEAADPEEFMEANFAAELPIALSVEVKDPLRLAAFLTAVRSFVAMSAPGVIEWQLLQHQGQPFVKGLVSERFQGSLGGEDEGRQLSFCYAVLPGRFTITLDERLIRRAIDRSQAPAPGEDFPEWNGRSVALRLEGRALTILEALMGPWREQNLTAASYRNIPILNEWKRLFPDLDPQLFHQRQFHQKLVCPGGGEYVWNEEYQSMESTAFGLPEREKRDAVVPSLFDSVRSASLGVTFEQDGLRARFDLERASD